MTEKMKTFVMERIGEVGFMEKPIPAPGPDDAVIKTTRALICTSDTHTVHGAIGERENLTLGHEAVGTVHQVGENVKIFEPGDRVVAGAITPDWFSLQSQAGHSSQSGGPLGGWQSSNTRDGVFGKYFLVNQADANLARIPDSVSDEAAVYCCDMLSTGFAGAEIGSIPIGGTVAVFALGPVGLMAVAGAKLRGAGLIIGVDTVEKRFELAREYGADEVLDFAEVDIVEAVLNLTDGEGVDTAIEALGSNQTFQQCIKVTKAGGTVANIGYHGEGEFLNIPREEWGVGMSEIDIKNILCPGGRLRMIQLLRIIENGRLDPTKMTTHTLPFDEIDRGFEIMEEKLEGVIKPLITF